MKLAEALIKRADLQRALAQLQADITANILVQEGTDSPFDVPALVDEYDAVAMELQKLIKKINLTNCLAELKKNKSLTDAIAERDILSARIQLLRKILTGGVGEHRYSRNELRMLRVIDLGEVRQKLNRLSQQYRELDTALQQKNWEIDLAD